MADSPLNIRFSRQHWLTYSPDALRDTGLYTRLPADAWDFLSSLSDEEARHVAVAFARGEIVGWMRCTPYRGRAPRGVLYAQGTWVAHAFRRQDVAFQLWETALRRLRPRAVYVATVSRGGQRLMAKCKKAHADIDWNVTGASRHHQAHVNLANF